MIQWGIQYLKKNKIIAIDPEICVLHKTSTSLDFSSFQQPPELLLEPPFPHQVLRSQLWNFKVEIKTQGRPWNLGMKPKKTVIKLHWHPLFGGGSQIQEGKFTNFLGWKVASQTNSQGFLDEIHIALSGIGTWNTLCGEVAPKAAKKSLARMKNAETVLGFPSFHHWLLEAQLSLQPIPPVTPQKTWRFLKSSDHVHPRRDTLKPSWVKIPMFLATSSKLLGSGDHFGPFFCHCARNPSQDGILSENGEMGDNQKLTDRCGVILHSQKNEELTPFWLPSPAKLKALLPV